jgi:hypothetical protein
MDPVDPAWYMEPQWFPVAFGAMWLGICSVLAILSGWPSLAADFRASERATGDVFRFVSGSMGLAVFPVSYGSCLFITVAPTGIHISILFLFRIFSPPLFIPWAEVESVEEKRFLLFRSTSIRIRGHWPKITLRGQSAQRVAAVYAQWSSQHGIN